MINLLRVLYLGFILTASFAVSAGTSAPDMFQGLRLGGHVDERIQQFDTNQRYLGFKIPLKTPFLQYDQLAFHASLKTRTITSISCGKVFSDKETAENLVYWTKVWIKKKYALTEEKMPGSTAQRKVWAFRFGSSTEDFRYFLVELNNPANQMWISMVTYFDTTLSALEERESKMVDYRTIRNPGVMLTSWDDLEKSANGKMSQVQQIETGMKKANAVYEAEEAKRKQTIESMRAIYRVVSGYVKQTGKAPCDLKTCRALFGSRIPHLKDAWNSDFAYEADGSDWAIQSMGPDKKLFTDDDITMDDLEGSQKDSKGKPQSSCGQEDRADRTTSTNKDDIVVPIYRVKGKSLGIPFPDGYSVASKKLESVHDKGKRAAGGSGDRRFVLFVRDDSLDSSGTYGDTLSVSLNDYSDVDVEDDQFKEFADESLKSIRKDGLPNVAAKIEDVAQGLRWYMVAMTMKHKLPRSSEVSIYSLTGMVLVDKHLYTYVANVFDPNESLKKKVRSVIAQWLTNFSGGSNHKVSNTEQSHGTAFYDITQVGEGCSSVRSYVSEESYRRLFDCEWNDKRTAGLEKAAGLDIKFRYPAGMDCSDGRQPHVLFRISKAFRNPVLHANLSVGVWPYDESVMEILKNLKTSDVKDPSFLEFVKSLAGDEGSVIGAGITTMESRSVIWITQQREVDRLGAKVKTISRSFFMPATGGRCVVPSVAIVVDGDHADWPYKDFESFNKVGLKFINSFTFMNKAQVGSAKRFDGNSSGTGWFVAPEYIVTCWHVIQGGAQYSCIKADGQSCMLTLVGKDEFSDLALLRVSNVKDRCATPLKFSGERPKVAQKVFTVGYPIPELMGKAPKYTEGVISALTGVGDDESSLQITTPVQSGNSGGALLNEKCEVVGIIQSKLLAPICNSDNENIQNVNYAVKSYLARRMIAKYSVDLPKNFAVGDPFETAKNATVFIVSK